jgi:hypothetical protein
MDTNIDTPMDMDMKDDMDRDMEITDTRCGHGHGCRNVHGHKNCV